MGYHNYGTAFVESIQILNYCPLIFGIKGIGSFIQKDEIRILIDCTSYEYALFLSLAQSYSVSSDNGLVF